MVCKVGGSIPPSPYRYNNVPNKPIEKENKQMARARMVTRTIIATEVTVLAMDIVKCEPITLTVTVPQTYKDEKKLRKVVDSALETDTIKVAHIVDSKEVETLYGMSELDFIRLAKVLDPETRKAIEADTTEE